MKISDLITESQQIDELKVGDIGKGISKGVGALSKGVGAVAGGVRGAVDAAKQGFQAGRSAVAGAAKPAAEPAAQDQTAEPAADQTPPAVEPKVTAAPKVAAPAVSSNDEVEVLKKEVDSIKTVVMKDIADLKQQVASLIKPAAEPDTTPGFMKSATDKIRDRAARQTQTQSVKRTGKPVNESLQLFRK